MTEPDFPIQTIYRVHITFLFPRKWCIGKDPCDMILESVRFRNNPVEVKIRVGEFPDIPNLVILEGTNLTMVVAERDMIIGQIRYFPGYRFFKIDILSH